MKRLLLWLIGVVLGVAVLLAAVMGVSYAFTTEGSRPSEPAQFGGAALEENGYCWQVPLLGAVLDKVYASPETLSVQKLGTIYEAHPALTLPEWATYAVLTVTNSAGDVVFYGTAADYDSFLYPANGEYKATLKLWRLPAGMTVTAFVDGATGSLHKNEGLEHPAKPAGWTAYAFRFTLQASAAIEWSAERVEQGGVVGVRITGMTGDTAPTVETDLGAVQATRSPSGWRAYIPAAYNASAGAHEITVTVNGESTTHTITVLPKDCGTVEASAEPAATEAANAEFRNTVWPLYEAAARDKQWSGGFICPANDYMTLIGYGQIKVVNGQQGAKSNSTMLYTIPGEAARAPGSGVVVLARNLALTGNTVVIDHGCGLRSYLYGLASISVAEGQSVAKGDAVGVLAEELTVDFKLGSKSIDPTPLYQTSGGLFWHEND